MELKGLLLVALGGAIGATARYAIQEWNPSDFPFSTLIVNVLGSFLLGILIAVAMVNEQVTSEIVLFAGVGALGAFTTMSTLSVDFIQLMDSGDRLPALTYMMVNFILCPLAAFIGWRYLPLVLS